MSRKTKDLYNSLMRRIENVVESKGSEIADKKRKAITSMTREWKEDIKGKLYESRYISKYDKPKKYGDRNGGYPMSVTGALRNSIRINTSPRVQHTRGSSIWKFSVFLEFMATQAYTIVRLKNSKGKATGKYKIEPRSGNYSKILNESRHTVFQGYQDRIKRSVMSAVQHVRQTSTAIDISGFLVAEGKK